MLSWKIAWRNLWRHKGKSLVIGGILFLGALLMTVGNAIIDGANQGLEENMINRFTGHLVIISDKEKENNVFFGDNAVKILPEYAALKQILQKQETIESFLPMARGMASILSEEKKPFEIMVFGVNFDDYQKTFLQNVTGVEGQLLKNGDRGVLISDKSREDMYQYRKFWVLPEGGSVVEANLSEKAREKKDRLKTLDKLVLMGVSSDSFGSDILIPVKGIFRFKTLNKVWQGINLMDIESYRECFGYITSSDNAATLSAEQEALLKSDSTDDLFADANPVETAELNTQTYNLAEMQQETQRTQIKTNPDDGAYNLIVVKLRPGIALEEGKKQLEQVFEKAQAGVKVLTWKEACLEVAQFASITQGALSVFVIFIFFVAIIVIMNTLSMAAIERTAEIGMMRAVGARKGFISTMFFAETSLLSFFFGGLGILAGIVTSVILTVLNISVASNDLLNLMFGGDTLHPMISLMGIVSGSLQLVVVTILAMLYPIRVARKITPLEAISRD